MIHIKDPCSESEYLIIDGSVSQGPANQALKRYTTILNGSQLSFSINTCNNQAYKGLLF